RRRTVAELHGLVGLTDDLGAPLRRRRCAVRPDPPAAGDLGDHRRLTTCSSASPRRRTPGVLMHTGGSLFVLLSHHALTTQPARTPPTPRSPHPAPRPRPRARPGRPRPRPGGRR